MDLTKTEILDIFEEQGFREGRMISGSKSGYAQRKPNHKAVWSANIVTKEHGKVWWGDLDLAEDGAALQNVADKLDEPTYVVRQSSAFFGAENRDTDAIIAEAVARVDPGGSGIIEVPVT